MRVLVTGGRDYQDFNRVGAVLGKLKAEHGIECVITGCADGADRWARNWARLHQTDLAMFAARWLVDGRKAGPLLNQRMIDEGKPDLVVAFPGGRGTADMVRRAKAASIEVMEVTG
ncbi:DUF2493 domain-containing protein [Siculibacillus lacustris]|uniref:DUF2493 domain-containing protein n=1 Tax=Siculibacillus lacustris TaxID=1549641 RepID=A0A4V2KSN0_9HYPH|nr:DUF2493 domain-containing protein [Siculibacillus lacustris]TBW33578.1 DUF2493 domain-containing protein [Siculibacillus lacustris]